jgi:hypothetical protein
MLPYSLLPLLYSFYEVITDTLYETTIIKSTCASVQPRMPVRHMAFFRQHGGFE